MWLTIGGVQLGFRPIWPILELNRFWSGKGQKKNIKHKIWTSFSVVRGPKMKYCTRAWRDVLKVCTVLEVYKYQEERNQAFLRMKPMHQVGNLTWVECAFMRGFLQNPLPFNYRENTIWNFRKKKKFFFINIHEFTINPGIICKKVYSNDILWIFLVLICYCYRNFPIATITTLHNYNNS